MVASVVSCTLEEMKDLEKNGMQRQQQQQQQQGSVGAESSRATMHAASGLEQH